MTYRLRTKKRAYIRGRAPVFQTGYRPRLEPLEARLVLASDFGDAPLPYPTLLVEGGAEHVAIGPTIGLGRDTEADGVHSRRSTGDDATGSDDEDGVTFGTIRTGALGATTTVNVQGGPAKLDAWIDFNGDGAWGGSGEQIADTIALATGNSLISFDVPSWAKGGMTYARFRLSTAGDLGVGGSAADGEVEDYALTIESPSAACGCFTAKDVNYAALGAWDVHAADVDGNGDIDVLSASFEDDRIAWYENHGNGIFTGHTITTAAGFTRSVYAADVDSDGDIDVLSAALSDDKIAWYENDGNENFTPETITTAANGAYSVYAADVDGDSDTDVLSASASDDKIAWYENDGNEKFTAHTITTAANGAESVYAADMDGDGDTDVLSASAFDDKIAWYENDGNENFSAHTITTAADGAESVYAADVDGDLDVLSASRMDAKINRYENRRLNALPAPPGPAPEFDYRPQGLVRYQTPFAAHQARAHDWEMSIDIPQSPPVVASPLAPLRVGADEEISDAGQPVNSRRSPSRVGADDFLWMATLGISGERGVSTP